MIKSKFYHPFFFIVLLFFKHINCKEFFELYDNNSNYDNNRIHHHGIKFTLDKLVINRSALSITSYSYKNSHICPEWVVRHFGNRSIFYIANSFYANRKGRNATTIDKDAQKLFQSHFILPNEAYYPMGYVELLGYVLLERASPFLLSFRSVKPSIGIGSLIFSNKIHWNCYYRAVYENWRPDMNVFRNYWATIIYCPCYSYDQCKQSKQNHSQHSAHSASNNTIRVEITLQLTKVNWTTVFHISPIKYQQNSKGIAVCA
eukprot:gene17432-24101_t